jgi:ADP-ribosyl-[dinitrogen reductase] hydrolase
MKKDKFIGSIIAGAIGDAWGSSFENYEEPKKNGNTFYLSAPTQQKEKEPIWQITDDTFFTLSAIDAIQNDRKNLQESVANSIVEWYKKYSIPGLGSSTLKAIEELKVGGHWSQVGRKGHFAAGNGAAMRIAPFSFIDVDLRTLQEICYITHQNDEAFTGALSVYFAIKYILEGNKIGLINYVIENIADTLVRDRLIEAQKLSKETSIIEFAREFGASGYVVESVPLAIFAASKVRLLGIEKVFQELIDARGDTDTNCSIAGQIMGADIGFDNIPKHLILKLKEVMHYELIQSKIDEFIKTEPNTV